MNYGLPVGRRRRKWARRWRRWVRRTIAERRVLEHIRRYYNEGPLDAYWQVIAYDGPEGRLHRVITRLGGEGRFGIAWGPGRSWNWNNQYVEWNPEEGRDFHVLIVGRFADHMLYGRDREYPSDTANRRRRANPYHQWTSGQFISHYKEGQT